MASNMLPTDYQSFIHTSRYARWLEDEQRRESWPETVGRYIENVVAGKVDDNTKNEIEQAILNLEVMPSMRAMMTAGPALDRDNTAGYNCSYLPVDDPKSFDEAMFILLCGTGVGFSVERQYVNKLPEVPWHLFESDDVIVVKDSKEGWAKAFRKLIAMLYAGEIPKWDVSKVRPAGAKLKTFGGRASGPGPLIDLFNFAIETFKGATGRKLSSIECHDLMCKIGEIVVVGGVRRSAMISLSNLSDDRMRHAKTGQFPPHRYLSNNSVAYTEKPDAQSFLREWSALADSGSGERGVFNRVAAKKQAAKFGRRNPEYNFGTNPCSEILLRPYQFCNLTEAVVRATDSQEDLARKVRIATILGTIQSTLTHFPYLRKVWKDNTEEERLLGVSLTGIFMKDQGIPNEPCVYKGDTTTVFSFPMRAPDGAVLRTDMTAIEQLEMWLTYQRHWCEHKPSVTVSVKKDEWFDVGAFVYAHFDEMSGVSFLPFDDHVYQQAPYQDCDRDTYEEMLAQMPASIDWAKLKDYEAGDTTKSSQNFACSGDSCEIVDIGA
jgi:ribonucleoside-diphosphate reductase alpha chain